MNTLQEFNRAMLPHIQRHSAVLWLRPAQGGLDVGSATCIEVGRRFFLATARHNIADLESRHQVLVTPAEGHFKREDSLEVQAFCLLEEPLADVAWLELDATAARQIGIQALPLERLGLGVTTPLDQRYIAAGAPAATSEVESKHDADHSVKINFRIFLTQPVEQASAAGDMKFEYSEKMLDSAGRVVSNYSPKGMSGGGLWSLTHEQPAVWIPDRCRLLGIVESYDPRRRFIRCVRIDEWLRLLIESVPETAREVRETVQRKVGRTETAAKT